jgi:dTDP-4-dehydrorhamnose reductase
MKNKIIILGAKGQLGTALCNLCEKKNIYFKGFDFPKIDISIPETYQKKIIDYNPDILINCAAYTNVYKAENDLEKSMMVNGIAVKHLVDLCNDNNIYLCHISTSYVFDGLKKIPYIETDKPGPVNYYGITKYVGEQIIIDYSRSYSIVRTADLFGKSRNNSNNIIKKLIELAQRNRIVKLVNDEFTSPTFTDDLAKQILLIINNQITGIMHATSEGNCNWVEFGKYLFELLDMDVDIEEVESSYFNKTLKKPKFSMLENKVLKDHSINIMPHWKEALKEYINFYNK